MEYWKIVEGTNGKIKVSSEGRVMSTLRGKPYILKTQQDGKGYHRLRVTIERKKYGFKLHRLVAMAFLPNPYNLPQVNHKDGNKSNNAVSNLEWVTNYENMLHAYKIGLKEDCSLNDVVGSNSSEAIKASNYAIMKINANRRKRVIAHKDGEEKKFDSIGEAERYFNSRHICDVLKGKRQTTKGWSFTYESEVV